MIQSVDISGKLLADTFSTFRHNKLLIVLLTIIQLLALTDNECGISSFY